MSLLSSFPHTIQVELPITGKDDAAGTEQVWWVPTGYASIPCQVTEAGGGLTSTFGGVEIVNNITISLTQPAIVHGCRVLYRGQYYRPTGGQGKIQSIGGIINFETWTCQTIDPGTTGQTVVPMVLEDGTLMRTTSGQIMYVNNAA